VARKEQEFIEDRLAATRTEDMNNVGESGIIPAGG